MKAKIIIDFESIGTYKVTPTTFQEHPLLRGVTKDTLKKVCETIEKYFQSKRIKVKANFESLD